ncbi:MAG: S46 family peptidase [Planctomycetota bacterium]|jgi:hypothetical protein
MLKTSVLVLLSILVLGSRPDEGQWLPQQVRAMDWAALEARGMQLSRDEFWHPTDGGVLSAAVQIGGCTASFCSPKGLVVTNHHCGFGAINQLSTPENNYLRDGFVAGNYEEELPAPGMVVYIVRRIENVTERIKAAQAKATNDLERYELTQAAIGEIVAEGEQEPNTTCSVSPFFEGREYHLYYRTRLTDVRLVYAPPRSVGEFGGEVDNWEWPRHTGDFSFFRAYAAPDGSPRAYHEDNVPFEPKHYLRVSADGVQEGDLALILGYPGRTERYLTSAAVADRQGYFYPKRLDILTEIVAILEAASKIDEESSLRYASTIKSIANVQKNAAGMVWGLAKNGVVARKVSEEAAFTEWVQASEERQKKYGSVLTELMDMDMQARRNQEKDLLLSLLSSPRYNPVINDFYRLMQVVGASDGKVQPRQMRQFSDENFNFHMQEVKLPILELLLDEARRLPEDQQISGMEVFAADPEMETGAILRKLLDASSVMTQAGRIALIEAGAEGLRESRNPIMMLVSGILQDAGERQLRNQTMSGRRIEVGSTWIEAQQIWRGKEFYPDANSTMRISIASVKGYQPRDGVRYVPHTTVAGVINKETGEDPFASPAALLSVADTRKESKFFDARIGDVPVCFLTDGDTTGGNSGSPVINGKGELVGLNFDRVFENVSGDFGWNAARSRNISVDIRYVLWIMESVQPATHLLKEMGVD